MLESSTRIKVMNRGNSVTAYSVPDLRITREFLPGEVKEVTFEELKSISYTRGGRALLKNNLLISNKEAVAELVGAVEPEYYYTEKVLTKILKSGSLDELLDTIDFAPKGIVQRLAQLAIELEIPDMNKRKAIQNATKIDITKAIELKDEEEQVVEEKKVRRTAPVEATEEEAPKRRAAAPSAKYKIVEEE